jgi:uncharacterized protein (TIGR00369 family)
MPIHHTDIYPEVEGLNASLESTPFDASHFSAPYIYEPRNPDFLALIDKKLKGQQLMGHLGLKLSNIQAGYIECYGAMDTIIRQQDGFLHGGMTSILTDIVTGFAAFTLGESTDRVVTSNLNVNYFSPGLGEYVFARGWVVKPGSRLMYCEGEVYTIRQGGFHLIGKGTSIMAVIKQK